MKTIFCLFLTLILQVSLWSQAAETIPKSFFYSIYQPDSILDITIETDIRSVIRTKRKSDYYAAQVHFRDNQGVEKTYEGKVRARGNVRKEVCFFPPIKLKFKKALLGKEDLIPNNELKIVSHCQIGDQYDQMVLREYFCYRLFNQLTDYSFRVQLARIHYKNTGTKGRDYHSYSILIEPEEDFEARVGGQVYEPKAITPRHLEAESFNLVSLFQYFIGNTDWAIGNQHNIKLFRVVGKKAPIVVPYDFDYSGLVNTPYAVPAEKLPIKSVTDRYFRGLCRDEGDYESAFAKINALRDTWESELAADYPFDKDSKTYLKMYLGEFFEQLEDPERRTSFFVKNCQEKEENRNAIQNN